MTEAEWLECTDPTAMLEFLRGKVSERKLRLFACACCRQISLRLGTSVVPKEIDASERFADGEASKNDLTALRSRLGAMGGYSAAWAANNALFAVLEHETEVAVRGAITHARNFAYFLAIERKRTALSDELETAELSVAFSRGAENVDLTYLLRDIFGNPFSGYPYQVISTFIGNVQFRQVCRIDPRWLTSTVLDLASAIYTERVFEHLPILADALLDAGCDDASILTHCREAEHVKGCWVVDLLLEKK
jgi:hypothetical protein